MLNIHIYGFLKKKFDPNARLAEQTIIKIDFRPNETFVELINRLNISQDELGDCFVNGTVISNEIMIPDESRVALFSSGMRLLCGGQHLKGHGLVEKTPLKKINYY